MTKRPVDLRTCFVAPLLALTVSRLFDILSEVISSQSAFIENLNRAQLFAGTLADGTEITPDYKPVTVFIKSSKGQRNDRVTLRDKGDFYESIFTDVFETGFYLKADDPKAADLRAKYSELILGLTDESKQKLINHIRPIFVERVRDEVRQNQR